MEPGVVAHAFNPSIPEAEAGGSLEFEVSLPHRGSCWTTRATWRDPALKNQPTK